VEILQVLIYEIAKYWTLCYQGFTHGGIFCLSERLNNGCNKAVFLVQEPMMHHVWQQKLLVDMSRRLWHESRGCSSFYPTVVNVWHLWLRVKSHWWSSWCSRPWNVVGLSNRFVRGPGPSLHADSGYCVSPHNLSSVFIWRSVAWALLYVEGNNSRRLKLVAGLSAVVSPPDRSGRLVCWRREIEKERPRPDSPSGQLQPCFRWPSP